MTHLTYYKRYSTPYAYRISPPPPSQWRAASLAGRSGFFGFLRKQRKTAKFKKESTARTANCRNHSIAVRSALVLYLQFTPSFWFHFDTRSRLACFSFHVLGLRLCVRRSAVLVSAANIIWEAQLTEWIWSSRLFPVDVCLQLLPHLQ